MTSISYPNATTAATVDHRRLSNVTGIMDILPTSSFATEDSTPGMTNYSVVRATTEVATYGQLMAFCQWYQTIHGYVCIFVCVFGIAANIMNIIVLTRRNMVSQSIPLLLYY